MPLPETALCGFKNCCIRKVFGIITDYQKKKKKNQVIQVRRNT